MGFQQFVEGGVAAFLRRYRRMMANIEGRMAALSPEKARTWDNVVIAINVLLFAGLVVCMWTGVSRWVQFALAVGLYVGYQVFHRGLADAAARK